MMDGKGALIQAHRNNIARYQRLLDTRLTDNERQYLESRLSEEQSALQRIAYSSLRPGEIEMQLKVDLDQPVRL